MWVSERPNVHMLADEFERSVRGSRIEREKCVAIVVVLLFPRLGIPNGSNFLHTSLVKLDGYAEGCHPGDTPNRGSCRQNT